MRILALEPYYGGSHKAFLDGWASRSHHEWTVLHLPASKWKWRMRHAAITFADEVNTRLEQGEKWDALFCSDMLNLAEFLGLADAHVRALPAIAYFHENQLTYPDRHPKERDHHFALTNLTTCLAATRVWFNSAYHLDTFTAALPTFLRRMPDYRPLTAIDQIRQKAAVHPPGVDDFPPRDPRRQGPLRILWAARWEHDKNPDDFFEALKLLKEQGVKFQVSVIGQQFEEVPPVFAWAHEHFRDEIQRWGFQESRDQYVATLLDADVIVSTANHEFFGIGVVEGIGGGVYPLLPRRLSYPEILPDEEAGDTSRFFYDGSVKGLARKLADIADRVEHGTLWANCPGGLAQTATRFSWDSLAPQMDDALAALV